MLQAEFTAHLGGIGDRAVDGWVEGFYGRALATSPSAQNLTCRTVVVALPEILEKILVTEQLTIALLNTCTFICLASPEAAPAMALDWIL